MTNNDKILHILHFQKYKSYISVFYKHEDLVLQNHQSDLCIASLFLLGNLLRLFRLPQHLDPNALSEGLRDEPPTPPVMLQQHHRDIRQTLLYGCWLCLL